jgi:pimeloyl-ACP methyl ester carboxylesterase
VSVTAVTVPDGLDAQKLHFVDVDGIRTRYYDDGTGEPLLLLHGGGFGSLYSLDSWSLNLPGLAQHFRVIALDRLGQGYTDNPKRPDDYSLEALFAHTRGFIQALGLRDVHVLGHSRGGSLATWLVVERPELFKTIVIVDSATTAPPDPAYPLGVFYENLDRQVPDGPPTRDTVRIEPDAQAYSRAQVTDDFVGRLLEIAQLPKMLEAQQLKKANRYGAWQAASVRRRDEVLARIDAAGLPVRPLVLWGFDDRSAPLPLGLQLFARIAATTPGAEMHVLSRAGHYSFREQPEGFNGALRGFCLR